MVLPVGLHIGPLGELPLPVLAQGLGADCRKRNRARGILGLGRYEAQRTADPLNLVPRVGYSTASAAARGPDPHADVEGDRTLNS